MFDNPSSVSEIIFEIKNQLESSFPKCLIEGEVSNLSSSSAGHWYFNLSDNQSSVSCALFKTDALRNPLIRKIKDGDKIIINGPVSVYTKRGTFQIIGKRIFPAGKGNLFLKYEQLKEQLGNEGLFDISLKKQIPKFPNKVAVITAKQGAALQDFLNVIKRRSFWGEIVIIPAVVQGDKSADSLLNALVNTMKLNVDLVVLTRGGGSIEDLWSFNDENFVRAIADFPIPVISAIGHQVDFTLSDFAADLRCETPSAAAEIISQGHMDSDQRLKLSGHRLLKSLNSTESVIRAKLEKVHPARQINLLNQKLYKFQQRVDKLDISKKLYELTRFYELHQLTDELMKSIQNSLNLKIERLFLKVGLNNEKLTLLNPQNVLERGYTIIKKDNTTIASSKLFNKIKKDDKFKIIFKDGTSDAIKK